MHKFYFKAQWVAAFLFPLGLLFGPTVLGLESNWESPWLKYLAAATSFLVLITIAYLTTSAAKVTGKNYLSLRITVLLESIYVLFIGLLFTEGKAGVSNSMVVSVLSDRGFTDAEAWATNDVTRVILFVIIFVFMATVLTSSLVEKTKFKHTSREVYENPY